MSEEEKGVLESINKKTIHWSSCPGPRRELDMHLPASILCEIDRVVPVGGDRVKLANIICDFVDQTFIGSKSMLKESIQQETQYRFEKFAETAQSEMDSRASWFLLELKNKYPIIVIDADIQGRVEKIMQMPSTRVIE